MGNVIRCSRSKAIRLQKAGEKIASEARQCAPKCIQCARRMEPCYNFQYVSVFDVEHGLETMTVIGGVAGYGYEASNLFCTLRCGYAYGLKAAKESQ